jgi:hypothetical protein
VRLAIVVAMSLAYLMPAYSILRRMAKGRDEMTITALKVDGAVAVPQPAAKELATALGLEQSRGDLQLTATWTMKLPGRCKLQVGSADSTKTAQVTWQQGKVKSEGPDVPGLVQAVNHACGLLALHSAGDGETRGAIEKHLSTIKIDTRKVSLARFLGTTAYVLGPRDGSGSQFWIYKDVSKDDFFPARVMFTDEGGAKWDVRFIDFASQATGEWFPRQIEVWKGDALTMRFTGLSGDGKPDADALKF